MTSNVMTGRMTFDELGRPRHGGFAVSTDEPAIPLTMNDAITIHPVTMADYEEAMVLWQRTDGIGLRPADAPEHIARFLTRNRAIDINKCHLFVIKENRAAIDFWQHIGWELRQDIVIMSHYTDAFDDSTAGNRS